MRRLIPVAALAVLAVACSPQTGRADSAGAQGQAGRPDHPITQAPAPKTTAAFAVETVATGLNQPWGLAFLADGRLLATEKAGRLRIVERDGTLSAPVQGVPRVWAQNQGGLLDVVVGPDGLIYFSYAEPRDGGTTTAVARARLIDGAQPRLEGVQVIFRQTPVVDSRGHFGSRLVFAPDGTLFVGLGDRMTRADDAQNLADHLGTVVRINADGSVPADNPFVGREGAAPEIWSYGHRNIQSAALNPRTGRLWTVEHGPRGGDEINIPQAGLNYGWPLVTHGRQYSGLPVGKGEAYMEGVEPPVYHWTPSIAPSGMAFYQGDAFPAWRDSLFVGALAGQHLNRVVLEGDRVVAEERLLGDLGERIRDVRVGPDGFVYVATDSPEGRILRLVPKR